MYVSAAEKAVGNVNKFWRSCSSCASPRRKGPGGSFTPERTRWERVSISRFTRFSCLAIKGVAVLAVTFADLWFRSAQFLIAVVGVGLVLALALGLSGLADGFHAEVAATVNAVGASSWVMAPSA